MSTDTGLTRSSRADEKDLRALREDGDPDARTRLIERHLPLVRRLAWRYRASGEPLEDLVQSGCLGLVKAIDRYDPARGRTLLAYAIPTVLGEMRRLLRDRGGAPSVPRPVRELGLSLRRVDADLTAALGRSPTLGELAEAAGAAPEVVVEALVAASAQRTVTLSPAPGDAAAATIEDEVLGVPDDAYELVEDRSAVAQALRVLDRRERTIVALSFFAELSQAQIAVRLGISQMHVSRLLRRALAKAGAAAEAPLRPVELGS